MIPSAYNRSRPRISLTQEDTPVLLGKTQTTRSTIRKAISFTSRSSRLNQKTMISCKITQRRTLKLGWPWASTSRTILKRTRSISRCGFPPQKKKAMNFCSKCNNFWLKIQMWSSSLLTTCCSRRGRARTTSGACLAGGTVQARLSTRGDTRERISSRSP